MSPTDLQAAAIISSFAGPLFASLVAVYVSHYFIKLQMKLATKTESLRSLLSAISKITALRDVLITSRTRPESLPLQVESLDALRHLEEASLLAQVAFGKKANNLRRLVYETLRDLRSTKCTNADRWVAIERIYVDGLNEVHTLYQHLYAPDDDELANPN